MTDKPASDNQSSPKGIWHLSSQRPADEEKMAVVTNGNGIDHVQQSHINLMKTKVDTLRALLSEKDAEYAEMCQQFEENLRSKSQQIKLLENRINELSYQNKQMACLLTTKSEEIEKMKAIVSRSQEAIQRKDVNLLHITQQEQSLQESYRILASRLQHTEVKLAEREQKLEKVVRECELVRQVQGNEIARLADINAVLREGLDGSSKKLEEKEELLHKLRKEMTSLVSDRNEQISGLEQLFQQKMTQVSTIQDHLAEEHKKCANLQKNMEQANKELHQLRHQHSGGSVNQYTQTSQSNGCNCNCVNSSKSPVNQDSDDLEALKKYHEDLEGTVSQLENILHVREKKITELEAQLTETMLAQKQHLRELRLKILQTEMEEKDTSIALLEISDGSRDHRGKIIELQEEKNVLMKMIRQHVGGDSDAHLVIDKTATQLRCLLEQLVNLVQHDKSVSDYSETKQNGQMCDRSNLLTHANVLINETIQCFKPHPPRLT